jgi:hypothetical protein
MSSYYLTNRSRYIYFGFLVVVLVVIMGLFLYFSRNIFFLQVYFLGCGLYSVYIFYQKLRNEHVVVTKKGIAYFTPGIILEVNWESIAKISSHWRYGFRHECLWIDNSQVRIKKWSLGSIPGPFEFVPRNTIIPLSCFSENWRDSELGRQIKQYAPHLFQ